jgi:threonine aldolase
MFQRTYQKFKGIDLYSDTLTQPTAAMRQAIANAEVGDEQKGEDPTTLRLEELAAEKLGQENALFLPSATMANQIAIRYHCQPGDEVIAAEDAHVFFVETGAMAAHSGVLAKPIPTASGIFSGNDIRKAHRMDRGPQSPLSRLVIVENTTNMGGGIAWSKNELDDVHSTAKSLGLKMHLDGSRLFNAAIASKIPSHEIGRKFDTVTLCLSKGLGCPAGAILAFPNEAFPKIRRLKQMFGGSFRQSGILAAAGVYALQHHIDRMREDHEKARELAKALTGLPYLEIENENPPTNMVYLRWNHPHITAEKFAEICESKGVRFSDMGINRYRAVTHLDIRKEDIALAAKILKNICSEV